jgi:DNA-binding NtrC family response regulator
VQEQLHVWAEAEIYRQALRISGGDVDKAGAALGVSHSTVRAQMSQYGLSSDGDTATEPAPTELTPESRTETKARVLVVEDDESDAMAMKRFLTKAGYDSQWVTSMAAALMQTQKEDFDLVVTDLDLKVPGASGLELISQLRALKPQLPVILLTGYHSPSKAIEATRLGAYDYLPKPVSWADSGHLAELQEMVKKAVQSKRLAGAPPVDLGRPSYGKDAIIGQSRAMQEVYKEIGRVAATPLTVLIRGETGTGKELVARAIYSHGDPERASQPFVEVNCAAIPPSLLESELFGHEKGAFTGAAVRRLGRFEQAHHGTIFLDEIGDMNVHLQQKLLRVLQEKTIVRVGGDESIPVDVRIIVATHRDLERAARAGSFRQDLYFRLNVAVINLPPLRERPEDIPDLVYYFLEKSAAELIAVKPSLQAGEEGAIFQLLQRQPWPGNIRELRNIVRRAVIMCRGFPISVKTIREVLKQTEAAASAVEGFAGQVAHFLAKAKDGERQNLPAKLLDEVERELYSQAIEQAGGDQTKAAKWLGVSRPTVMAKMLKHRIPWPRHDSSGSTHPASPVVSGHQIVRFIARGGFGTVWLALDQTLGTFRAVKVIQRGTSGMGGHYQRELDGIRSYEPISREYPPLLDILQVSEDNQSGCFYYVMELADDEERGREISPAAYRPRTLAGDIERRGGLSLRDALKLALDMTDALVFLHGQSPPRFHRDIKPANIIYVEGKAKLGDPGLMTDASHSSKPGTPAFMDIETHGTAMGDVYSLGKTLAAALAGTEEPVSATTASVLVARISTVDENPELFSRFQEVIRKACAGKEHRFRSAREMFAAIEQLHKEYTAACGLK